MGVDLHGGDELLLRSRFLAGMNNNELEEVAQQQQEEEGVHNITLSHPTRSTHQNGDFGVVNYSGFELPTLCSSSMSSISSSEQTETETETDEDDDYIAELTRQMAHYMFQDDDKRVLPTENIDKSWGLAGCAHNSPLGSKNLGGTPKWSCQEPISSPPPSMPAVAANENENAWDSKPCGEDTGKLEQLNILNNQGSKSPKARQFQSTPSIPTSSPISLESSTTVGPCSSNQAPLHQIPAIEFHKMKRGQVFKQQGSAEKESQPALFQQNNRAYSAARNGGRPYGYSTATRPNSHAVGSGMRAVFLGGSGSQSTGSSGTGVFLPCVIGNRGNMNRNRNQSQSRKKRGCSPVLIPAKVLQALQVHFDRMGHQRSDLPEASSTFTTLQHDNHRVERTATEGKCPEKKRHSRAVPAMNHAEVGLPQEWTY